MSIKLENLTKRYDRQTVVKHVSLEIADGELFVLLGASGSGKSTVLRMIAGLATCDEGRILIKGRDVTHLAPQPRGTGFVFQNYSIFRHMTVAENIQFGLKIRNVSKADRAARCEELLDLVGLAGFGDRYADQLSGGQQQRVALARALAYSPSVLLLDEPLGALDAKIRIQLRRSLREIQRRLSLTTLLVTHDQEEAYEMADRIGVMEHGTLLEVGSPEDLYSRPRTLYVASFLGGGTVLGGRASGGQARLGPITLPIPSDVLHEDGASVEMLFRPEDVTLTPEPPTAGQPILGKAKVVEQSFSGAVRRVRLRLPPLAATRQVSPPSAFGEEGLIIEVVLPAQVFLPNGEYYLGLRKHTILAQSPARLLVLESAVEGQSVMELARNIGKPMNAAITILANSTAQHMAEFRKQLDQQARDLGFDEITIIPASGDVVQQVSSQRANALFDFIILPRHIKASKQPIDQSVISFLEKADIPTIVAAPNSRAQLTRILICTRAGESGKSDILLGGRLARYVGARVTLLHVTKPGTQPAAVVKRHFQQASVTLRGMDVDNEVSLVEGADSAEVILNAAQQHDMIVVGAHGGQGRSLFGKDDVSFRVVSKAPCPVLIVPVED